MEMRKTLANILNFAYLDIASWFGSLWSWLLTGGAILGGVTLALVQKYLVRDLAFIPWLILAILCDTVTGYMLANRRYKADPAKYAKPSGLTLKEKLAGKLTAITVTLILLNIITNFEISGIPAQQSFIDIPIFGYEFDLNIFKAIYYSGATYLIFAEAKSTIRNLRAMGYNTISTRVDEALEKITGEGDKDHV